MIDVFWRNSRLLFFDKKSSLISWSTKAARSDLIYFTFSTYFNQYISPRYIPSTANKFHRALIVFKFLAELLCIVQFSIFHRYFTIISFHFSLQRWYSYPCFLSAIFRIVSNTFFASTSAFFFLFYKSISCFCSLFPLNFQNCINLLNQPCYFS